MNNVKGRKKGWIAIMIVSFFIICQACLILTKIIPTIGSANASVDALEKEMSLEDPEWYLKGDYIYVLETCYAGNPFLPGRLFKYPFKKTDAYFMNKEFINEIGIEGAEILTKIATDTVLELFDVTCKNQSTDMNIDVLEKNLDETITTVFKNGIEYSGRKETIEKLSAWYSENKLTTEATFTTDKSLIYYDDQCIYVRGQLLFTVYKCEDMEEIATTLGFSQMETGKQYSLVLEIKLIPQADKKDFETYQVAGISIIENAEF